MPHHRILAMLTLLALLAGCGGPAAERVTVPSTQAPAAPPTALLSATAPPAPTITAVAPTEPLNAKIDVGGYRLHMLCAGTGSPTVVIDSGLATDTSLWGSVLLKASKISRICAYDRAGMGESDAPLKKPRTSQDMVDDLHTLLSTTNSPPYVLVGWSVAGLNVRLFAHQYPAEVAGIVFVDAVHPDQDTRLLALVPPAASGESVAVTQLRDGLSRDANGPSENPEAMDVVASRTQVRSLGALGALPIAVLTAGQSYLDDPDIPKELQAPFQKEWEAMQNELAQLSSKSTHTVIPLSHHCIPCDYPDAVAKAIKHVVTQVHGS